MIYVAGIIGFIVGFLAGQVLLLRLLRGRTRQELLDNKSLRYTYGLFNWLTAGLGAWLFVELYRLYF